MLSLLQSASDDQKALLGCLAALLAAGLVLSLSYYLSPARRQDATGSANSRSLAAQPIRSIDDRAA